MQDFDVAGAERIGIPKGYDSEPSIRAFQESTGIEVPDFQGRELSATSQGRIFFLLKGKDMPGLAASGLIDLGVAGTDTFDTITLDARPSVPKLQYLEIGEPMCRLDLMAEESKKDELETRFWRDRRRPPARVMPVATSMPKIVNYQAAALDLPIQAVELPAGVTISGSFEIMPRLLERLGVELVADRVQTGRTATEAGLVKITEMLDIYPALLQRFDDESL